MPHGAIKRRATTERVRIGQGVRGRSRKGCCVATSFGGVLHCDIHSEECCVATSARIGAALRRRSEGCCVATSAWIGPVLRRRSIRCFLATSERNNQRCITTRNCPCDPQCVGIIALQRRNARVASLSLHLQNSDYAFIKHKFSRV